MIVNLIRNKEYKTYKIVTFLKDYFIISGVISVALIIILLVSSYIDSDNFFMVAYRSEYFWKVFRILTIVPLFISVYVNKKSHEDEMVELNKK